MVKYCLRCGETIGRGALCKDCAEARAGIPKMPASFAGYVCLACRKVSDKRKDWVIAERSVRCRACGSENVEPYNINRGLKLKK